MYQQKPVWKKVLGKLSELGISRQRLERVQWAPVFKCQLYQLLYPRILPRFFRPTKDGARFLDGTPIVFGIQ